jgi:hypothetical protein
MEKKNYIWRIGILRFGLPMFVLMTVVSLFVSRNLHPITLTRVIFAIIVGLLIWPAAGALWGLVMWQFARRRYARSQ